MQQYDRDNQFVGTWVSTQPFDSDDYLVEYTISRSGRGYKVAAKDYKDGEHMKISAVKFDGHTLEFMSLMPSTGRKGVNRFSIKNSSTLTSEFTFTVLESLKRIDPLSAQHKDEPTGKRTTRRGLRKRRA